ncbi:MAG: hypothetical protein H8D23_23385 [Candidatus Brocadiales bacterium]|nr:hypothetical protein [Candidatus Brocadiales bacterium]
MRHHYHFHHKRHLTHEQCNCVEQYLIIFFICLIIAMAVVFFVEKAPVINEQMKGYKLEMREARTSARDLIEKPARDYINYGGRFKKNH